MADPGNDKQTVDSAPFGDSPPGAAPGAGSLLGSAWVANFIKRVLTGVPALLGVLLLIAVAPMWTMALLAAAAGMFGIYEYTRMVEAGGGVRLPLWPMMVGAAAIGLGGLTGSAAAMGAGLWVGIVAMAASLWLAAADGRRDPLREMGVALIGLVLVPWLLNHVGLLALSPGGRGFLAFLIVVLSFSDTLAYLVGTFLGRRPLLPAISPHKTVEGAIGGLVGGAVAGVLARLWMGGEPAPFSLFTLVGLGVLLAIAGQCGDLLESKLKRLCNANDSGRFLPGHGGLLDRVDAYLLAGPLAYYLLRWVLG